MKWNILTWFSAVSTSSPRWVFESQTLKKILKNPRLTFGIIPHQWRTPLARDRGWLGLSSAYPQFRPPWICEPGRSFFLATLKSNCHQFQLQFKVAKKRSAHLAVHFFGSFELSPILARIVPTLFILHRVRAGKGISQMGTGVLRGSTIMIKISDKSCF